MENYSNTNGKGYRITACDCGGFIPGALHVEMSAGAPAWIYDDESAGRAAQRDGIRLVYGIPYIPDGLYLNTPENRKILEKHSEMLAAAVRRRREKAERKQ